VSEQIDTTEDGAPESERRWTTSWVPTIHFPMARAFSDLFEQYGFAADRPREMVWLYVDSRNSATARGIDWPSSVRPTTALAAFVKERMTNVVDLPVYFQIYVRDDDSVLVLAKYDGIIGNRWLAEIDLATIPRKAGASYHHPAKRTSKIAPGVAPPALPPPRKERMAELLGGMVVSGNLARFGSSEKIDDWHVLKDAMEGLGGQWVGGKTQGFRFGKRVDVAGVIAAAIATGKVTTEAKEAEFIPSTRPVAVRVVDLARLRPGDRVLEPSAGRGAIADVVREREPSADLTLCELLEDNRDDLVANGYGAALLEERDFGKVDAGKFDVVVMNPPFAHEIAHVTRAFGMLRPGGRLASVMSGGVTFRQDAATKAFRAFVEAHGFLEELPDQSFKAHGTGVSTIVVFLEKPAAVDEAQAPAVRGQLALFGAP
jgi:hypothetical protein